ncbi:MAG TPA: hypothetical protein VGF28_23220 [Thermoanaerobaculia bacterium]
MIVDERVREAIDNERFDVVLEALGAIEGHRELHPQELLLKARCLQLHESPEPRHLVEAEEVLKKILQSDSGYVPALVELGWFYLNVKERLPEASELFEKALTLAAAMAAEALVGLSRCTEESVSRDAALSLLKERAVVDQEVVRQELERLSETR